MAEREQIYKARMQGARNFAYIHIVGKSLCGYTSLSSLLVCPRAQRLKGGGRKTPHGWRAAIYYTILKGKRRDVTHQLVRGSLLLLGWD